MDIRASDEDRERAIDILREATSRGYITLAEFEERLATGLAATYLSDLDPLLADLPGTPRPSAGWTVPSAGARSSSAAGANPYGGPFPGPAPAPMPGGQVVYRTRGFLATLPPVARVVLTVILIGMVASAVVSVLSSGIWIVALIVFLCVRRGHHRRLMV